MMKLRRTDITANLEHPQTLCAQMRWSKNITEERESPRQILLGSMDEKMCVLLNRAIYLELSADADCEFLFGNGSDGDRAIRAGLKEIIDALGAASAGNIGTHSVRKGPATYCARCGMPKDDIESRGRWRGAKRQVDTYVDIQRPYPDARVAACLCGPCGPAIYKATNQPRLTDAFLLSYVAPQIANLMGNKIAATLVLPLLWASVQNVSSCGQVQLLPVSLSDRIRNSIRLVCGTLPSPQENPVQRTSVVVTGHDGFVGLVELGLQSDVRQSSQPTDTSEIFKQMIAMHSTIHALKQRMEAMHSAHQREIGALRESNWLAIDRLHKALSRIADRPVARRTVPPTERQHNQSITRLLVWLNDQEICTSRIMSMNSVLVVENQPSCLQQLNEVQTDTHTAFV